MAIEHVAPITVAGAFDEGHGRVDGVGELHLFALGVVEEARAAVADDVADEERHFDRVTTKPRLVAAEHHVARLDFGAKPAQLRPPLEVVACPIIVDLLFALGPRDADVVVRHLVDREQS